MSSVPPLPYAVTSPPPAKAPGRPAGSPNKVSGPLKEAILLAAAEAGDKLAAAALEKGETREGGLLGYLTAVALEDVKSFCGLLGKVLPMQVTGAGGGALEVVFRTVYEEAPPKLVD